MRDEKLSTTVTEEEKQHFREIAAIDGKNMSQKLRELVYKELEAHDRSTSKEGEGNQTANPPTRGVTRRESRA